MNIFLNYLIFYLCLNFSNALVDVTIDQTSLSSGFHRLITTNVTLYGNLTSCRLLLEEKFPKNMFINAKEADDADDTVLTRTDGIIDTEATASSSNSFSMYIYLNRNEPVHTSSEFGSKYVFTLPVHIRYHDPRSGGGQVEFRKQPVTLFARCSEELNVPSSIVVKLPCDSISNKVCKWTSLQTTQKNVLPPMTVPVGNVDHHLVVFLSTHIVAYIGVILIIYNLLSS